MLAGLILAGGRSSRFGSDKAAAVLHGRSFLEIVVLALRGRCAHVAVSARRGSQAAELAEAMQLPVLIDRDGDAAGPLAGVRAGLAWAKDLGVPTLAVRPVDAPFIPPDTPDHLLAAIGPAPAAYVMTERGPEPLCALWMLTAIPMLDTALAGGRHPSTHGFLDAIGAARWPAPDADAFANVNTVEELARAEAGHHTSSNPAHSRESGNPEVL